ncbi:amidohydrolase family protein [uncultured Hyphomonas sp.]|uniref:amidohydrolase family protein n=1 Tax=uncultured Hyphomonas sp. TaxID=225298 RepID=UPI00261B8E7F|nr:amidohydrolase family protein [uncultured Hyphomonas sp.]
MRSHNILILTAALATLTSCTLLSPAYGDGTEERPEPVAKIIDVHRHGTWPTGDDDAYRSQMLSEMSQNGVRLAVISITDYDDVENWKNVAPDAFLVGVMLGCPRNLAEPRYNCFPADEGWVDIEWLRTMVEHGKIEAIHEVIPNYYGVSVGNPRYDPYFALAEEYDLPVGVHTQRGPPPKAINSMRSDPDCCPDYDPEMGNPALLRRVLERHPNLRVWIQHVGAGRAGSYEPHWDETLALLRDYPQVNVDLSITNGPLPIELYDESLRILIEAGFEDRIMMGTDNIPTALVLGRLESIEWLSDDQREAILYNNAERFFQLK